MTLSDMYTQLLHAYGPQGWWPILGCDTTSADTTGGRGGYHPGDYSYPRSPREQYEICLGAILTQNTAWTNAETALARLRNVCGLEPQAVATLSERAVAEAVRPAGYFNVKSRKIRAFTQFHLSQRGGVPRRAALLGVWGVGPETADSMLLYAHRQLEMVVDAYTRRILAHLGQVTPDCSYAELKAVCTDGLPADLAVYQEFHALIVEHAKRHYRKRPYNDPLLET